MSFIMVDVETDGPCPGLYSMVSFGAVVVEPGLGRTIYRQLRPISSKWQPEALAVCNITREQSLRFSDPLTVMQSFAQWVKDNSQDRPVFISDNNGFDWQFVNYYFHRFVGENPFGHSSQNLGSLYKGMVKDFYKSFKHLRVSPHDHNPLNDAISNAEALLRMQNELGLSLGLK